MCINKYILINIFHRKDDVIHVSAQRRSHFQINSNQEVILHAKRTCFIHGWVEHVVLRFQSTRPELPYQVLKDKQYL